MRAEITPRMLEMIRLRAQGKCVKTISRETGLSVNTVADHCSRTLVRINAKSMEHAVAIAARRGWLDGVEL